MNRAPKPELRRFVADGSGRNLASNSAQHQAKRGLRIGIAASGRFHLLDLARELSLLGADVHFYSYVSQKRATAFGLPVRCHVALLPLLFPLVGMERLFPRVFPRLIERLLCWALDMSVILRMRPCDVFICMSGMYLWAAWFAKWKYGALIHLHRSSRHILSQQEILARLPGSVQVSPFMVQRELKGYQIADRIIVPSTHVVESFAAWPKLSGKLFLNPLGVDINQFPLRQSTPPGNLPTVIFVGQWSYRKGVDVLVEAMHPMSEIRLIHVGALSDAPFPDDPKFVHQDHVPQHKLPEFYAMAHVCVLPSREDGFGVVLLQALSSGLHVVCTDRTGGPDLARLPGISRLIRIVVADDAEALRRALAQALGDATGKTEVAPITDAERQMLGWNWYARRDLQFMEACCAQSGESYHDNAVRQ
jgi:glycosyltransferase involved in cell wall biosynthesis